MTAFLIVRAEVDPAARDEFDAWYQDIHLQRIATAYGAAGAWRGWSTVNDNVHVACYEFADLAEVDRVTASDERSRMLGEFARRWQGQATWTREVVESIQAI